MAAVAAVVDAAAAVVEGAVAVLTPADVTVSVALAVLSAFTYTFGLALQQKANLATPTMPAAPGRGIRTAGRVIANPVWLAGFGLGVFGFLLHGVALAVGSLTLVQVVQVSQIVFLVPLSAWVARIALRRKDWLGGGLVAVGLVGLLLAVLPGDDTRAGNAGSWTATVVVAGAVIVILAFVARRSPWRAPILGAAAGVVFGVESATLKVASDNLAGGFSLGGLLGVAAWATLGAGRARRRHPEPGVARRQPGVGAGQPHHQLTHRGGHHRRRHLR